ncbi:MULTISPECIES: hypothetical protein [unclassified Leifsonia]|uniref:hypothetical protein n=1 Tax=unclassified Leifsonia TaxID=2663824 RepID=UPI0006FFAE41|nr:MULTISPECIES: hypothetical protein [unclassified Leifsonia]KQX08201.1 hypothetical protein ASC59_11100 [Leifsonia sp. Root1293]KRA12483.1 hypothetical protein ASD61_11100 [Leifsonia sp. Root60]
MSQRNTLVRSLHDLGLAAWFGGSLMGAVGLNGAAAKAEPANQKLVISSVGWGRWAPVQLAALAAHGVGGVGLIVGNKARIAADSGTKANTVVKLILTGVAGGATLYSAILGGKIAKHAAEGEGAEGVTEPGAETSHELAATQSKQRVAQWVLPVVTGVLIVLAAQQGEQQRPVAGWLHRVLH